MTGAGDLAELLEPECVGNCYRFVRPSSPTESDRALALRQNRVRFGIALKYDHLHGTPAPVMLVSDVRQILISNCYTRRFKRSRFSRAFFSF
jgi:hypothetical protein